MREHERSDLLLDAVLVNFELIGLDVSDELVALLIAYDDVGRLEIDADPEAMTVAYTVDYVRTDGSEASGDVVLGLVYQDGQYLIAREG